MTPGDPAFGCYHAARKAFQNLPDKQIVKPRSREMKSSVAVQSTPFRSTGLGHRVALDAQGGQSCGHYILFVDDEIVGTQIRAQILEVYGYSVVVYHHPPAALECDLSIFALAVIDFQMPGLNGRELLLRMRALGARFPIVLLTGCADRLSHEDRVLFARCIDKGTSIKCLLDTIEEFLDPNQLPDFGT